MRPALADALHASITRTTRSGLRAGRVDAQAAGGHEKWDLPLAPFKAGAFAARATGGRDPARRGAVVSQPMNCCKGENSPLNVKNVIPMVRLLL